MRFAVNKEVFTKNFFTVGSSLSFQIFNTSKIGNIHFELTSENRQTYFHNSHGTLRNVRTLVKLIPVSNVRYKPARSNNSESNCPVKRLELTSASVGIWNSEYIIIIHHNIIIWQSIQLLFVIFAVVFVYIYFTHFTAKQKNSKSTKKVLWRKDHTLALFLVISYSRAMCIII